jgi:hypothetical protein
MPFILYAGCVPSVLDATPVWTTSYFIAVTMFIDDDDDDDDHHHVDGVRLRPPTGLFIPHMRMGNHGGLISTEENCSSTRVIWQSYQQGHTVASRRNMRREWWIRSCEGSCKWFFTCRKILRRGASGFTSPPKEALVALAGFEPANLKCSGKHANHDTTEATDAGIAGKIVNLFHLTFTHQEHSEINTCAVIVLHLIFVQ